MGQVLHVQTRAYPFNHRGTNPPADPLELSDGGTLDLAPMPLASLAYRTPESTLAAEVTAPITAAVGGAADVAWAHLRVLSAGSVLLTTAIRPGTELPGEVGRLVQYDAALDRRLRGADHGVVSDMLQALLEAGVLLDPRPRLDWPTSTDGQVIDDRAVRYNCHFISSDVSWEPDSRGRAQPLASNGTRCHLLLSYTYAWDLDVDAEPATVLGALEPAELALCEMATTRAASVWAVDTLEALSHKSPTDVHVPVWQVRQQLDRIRSTYHRLDAYRYNSGQEERAIFLAARLTMGLDAAHDRTETILGQVAESLRAAVDERSAEQERRLNRFAVALAAATAGVFVLDLVAFARADVPPPLSWRLTTVLAVVLAGITAATWVVVVTRRRRRRQGPTR